METVKAGLVDERLVAMAGAARALGDDDWGSARQVAAQNAFFLEVERLMHPVAWDEFEMWALKATVDEKVDEALRLLGEE